MYIKANAKVTEGYKKVIFGFVIITVILVVVVMYFSASRAVINVVPRMNQVETDFVVDVATDGVIETQSLQGLLYEAELQEEATGKATGAVVLEGNSIGKVTLINNRAEDQVLVKTTRLLSEDNILLRLSERVTVPAKSEIEAAVYADDPNAFETIDPGKFTIPGLWEGIQDEVYAQSDVIMKSTGESVKAIDEVDIAKAKELIERKLTDSAENEFKASLSGDYKVVVISKNIIDQELSANPGDQVDQFNMKMKMKLVLIAINNNDILTVAGERLQSVVPDGKELVNLNLDNFSYTVQNFDNESKVANIKVHIEGQAVVKSESDIFNKEKLVGLSPKGVELYLANFEEIESAEVVLSPFWVKKVPKLRDHIDIVVDYE